MEGFEYVGEWWLVGNFDNQLTGTLKFDPLNRIILELVGSFKSLAKDNRIDVEIIHGVTSGGDLITLLQCYGSKKVRWSSGFQVENVSYEVGYIIKGQHFDNATEITLKSLSISYSSLAEWLNVRTFTERESNFPQEFHIEYKRPLDVVATVNNFTVSIRHGLSFNMNLTEVNLKNTPFVRVELDKAIHFEKLLTEVFYQLRNLLSLGLGISVYPRLIKGRNETDNEISIFFPTDQPSVLPNIHHPHNMLFSFPDIAEDFQRIIEIWFKKAELLDPVFELYFGVLYSPDMYPNVQFLLLAQALEVYHQRMYPGQYMPKKEYKTVSKRLNDKIPDDLSEVHKESLRSRISFGNEFTLDTRLNKILSDILLPYESVVDKLVGNKTEFIKRVKNTRNFLTHRTESSRKNSITEMREMFQYVLKMKLILQLCLLIELEIPQSKAMELIGRNTHFSRWLS